MSIEQAEEAVSPQASCVSLESAKAATQQRTLESQIQVGCSPPEKSTKQLRGSFAHREVRDAAFLCVCMI